MTASPPSSLRTPPIPWSSSRSMTVRRMGLAQLLTGGRSAIAELLRCIRRTGASRERGIAVYGSHGGVLVFVDSDDQLERDAVETLAHDVMSGSCDYVTSNYRVMDADGGNLRSLGRKRSHGAPWGRACSREVWRSLRFPEGIWFEDTVQAYCINGSWREHYVESFVYRYRKHGESITAK